MICTAADFMNFLEDAPRIKRNRQLAAVNRILSLAIMAVILFSARCWVSIRCRPVASNAKPRHNIGGRRRGAPEALRRDINEKMAEINGIITDIRANAANRGYGMFLTQLPSLAGRGRIAKLEIDEKQGVIMSGLALENAAINELKSNLRSAKILRAT